MENGEKQWSLTAFGKKLEMIVGEEEGDSIEEKMLLALIMKYLISKNIVQSVTKTK